MELRTPRKQVGLSAELRQVINERNMLTTRTKKKMIEALEEINDNEDEMNRKELKERTIQEILSSEVNYLSQLELIIDFFMKPIKERRLITDDDFQTLFGSIETMYKVNEGLLNELKKNPTNIAVAFSNVAPFFKHYSVYAYDFKKSLILLQKLQNASYNFNKFLDMQESRPEVQSKLSALLITPIQRVPRYRLLLKQVMEYTSPKDDDHVSLKESLKKIEVVVKHINCLVEEQENMQRMIELQRCLLNNRPVIIKPGRKIIKEGILIKLSKNGSSSYKRYFILMSDILMFCRMKNQNPKAVNSLKCSSIFPLNKCKFTKVLSKGCFRINCQDEEVVVYDKSLSESKAWVEALEETYWNYVESRKTLRKDSTVRRPVKRKDIDEYSDLGVSPGIKRTKRLTYKENDYENVFKNIANDSIDDTVDRKNFFKRLKKKKNILKGKKTNEEVLKEKKTNEEVKTLNGHEENGVKDSLYPLRKKLQIATEESPEKALVEINTNRELFVFGAKNEDRRFTFKICNYFSTFANCFKKALGFK